MSETGEHGLSRRELLLGASALGASGILGACTATPPLGLPAENTPPSEDTRKLSGRITVALSPNPPRAAREALTEAYRRRRPEVEVLWAEPAVEPTDTTTPEQVYDQWLADVLRDPAAAERRPDVVTAGRVSGVRVYADFEEYRARTNPHVGRPWSEVFDFAAQGPTDAHGDRTAIGTECVGAYWFYNESLLSRAEVTPPTTWDELVAACGKLQALGVVPVSAAYSDVVSRWFPAVYFDQYHVDWVETVRAREGDWCFDPELDGRFTYEPQAPDLHATYTFNEQRFLRGIRDGALRFDTPRVAAIVENLLEVFPRYAGADFAVRSDQYAPFLQQRAAFMVHSSEAMPILRADLEGLSPTRETELAIPAASVESFDWNVMRFPSMTGPLVASEARAVESPTGGISVVDKGPAQTEIVMDFLMFWFSGAGYPAFLEGANRAGELVAHGPLLVQDVRYPDHIQALFDREAVRPRRTPGPRYGDFFVNGLGDATQQTGRALRAHLGRVLRGELTPAEYGRGLQQYVERHLPQMVAAVGLTDADLDTPARRPAALA